MTLGSGKVPTLGINKGRKKEGRIKGTKIKGNKINAWKFISPGRFSGPSELAI